MPMNPPRKRSWRLFLLLLAGALAASVWAAVVKTGCGSCSGAGALLDGRTLPIVGAVFYAILLGTAAITGRGLIVFAGIQIAAGIHGALLVILVHKGVFCPPCITVSIAAIVAFGVSIRLEPQNLVRATYRLPASAFFLQALVFLSGGLSIPEEAAKVAQRKALEEIRSDGAQPGARLVAFTRPDCGYCIDLERYVLPKLKAEFKDRLRIDLRPAGDLPGLPTPTIIIEGRAGRRMFPGLPPEEELRGAVLEVMGERNDIQTVLSKYR